MLKSFHGRAAAACLAICIASAGATRAGEADRFLPKETDLVVTLNVRQVLDCDLVKKHALDLIKTTLANSKEAQETIKALGLDPLTDFKRVTAGLGLDDLSNPKAVVVIEGKFDPTKIANVLDALVKKDGKQFSAEKVGGKTVYKISTPNAPVPIYTAPIDSNVLVMATAKEHIGSAFEAVKGTRKSEIKKELADLLSKADAKSSLTLVAYTKGKLDGIPLPDDVKKVVDQIQSVTIDLKVEKDINLELVIGAGTADAAKQMQLVIAAGLDIAKLQGKGLLTQQPELEPLFDLVVSMKAIQKEKAVVITGAITGEAIGKALKKDK